MKMMFFVLLSILLMSCASKNKEERDIDQKAAKVNVSNPEALGNTIQSAIQSSKNLTDAQKQELERIIADNKKLAMELSEKSYQYRAVLIQELLSGEVKQKRIRILENDIKKVEDARLKNTFDTVKKISAIVTHQSDRQVFKEHLLNFDRTSR